MCLDNASARDLVDNIATFTFREFSFYPKRLAICTFDRKKRNNNIPLGTVREVKVQEGFRKGIF